MDVSAAIALAAAAACGLCGGFALGWSLRWPFETWRRTRVMEQCEKDLRRITGKRGRERPPAEREEG